MVVLKVEALKPFVEVPKSTCLPCLRSRSPGLGTPMREDFRVLTADACALGVESCGHLKFCVSQAPRRRQGLAMLKTCAFPTVDVRVERLLVLEAHRKDLGEGRTSQMDLQECSSSSRFCSNGLTHRKQPENWGPGFLKTGVNHCLYLHSLVTNTNCPARKPLSHLKLVFSSTPFGR